MACLALQNYMTLGWSDSVFGRINTNPPLESRFRTPYIGDKEGLGDPPDETPT